MNSSRQRRTVPFFLNLLLHEVPHGAWLEAQAELASNDGAEENTIDQT